MEFEKDESGKVWAKQEVGDVEEAILGNEAKVRRMEKEIAKIKADLQKLKDASQ